MSRVIIEEFLHFMDQAFEARGEHSLLRNLEQVTGDDWLWVPPGGNRFLRQIVGHVGACKYMYDDYAFGNATMSWNDPAGTLGCTIEDLQSGANMTRREPPIAAIVEWLRDGHRLLREHVALLDDGELLKHRPRPEGGMKETRWIIGVMTEHDLYHAGEINHIRALRQGNDRWAWETE